MLLQKHIFHSLQLLRSKQNDAVLAASLAFETGPRLDLHPTHQSKAPLKGSMSGYKPNGLIRIIII